MDDRDGKKAGRGRGGAGGVWLRETRRPREAPPLTRGRIVEEAIALLDEEGAGRLTMRRLAERLDTGSTTLYWHVETKDDVLDLALDAIFGEVPVPPGSGPWRAEVRALMGGWRSAMLRHPWSAGLLGRPLLGPNVLARTEFLHAALAAEGLRDPRLTAAAFALSNFVIGSAMMQATWQIHDEAQASRAAHAHLRAHGDLYPTLAAHGYTVAGDWDTGFEHGLDYLLDAIEADIEKGSGKGSGKGGGKGSGKGGS